MKVHNFCTKSGYCCVNGISTTSRKSRKVQLIKEQNSGHGREHKRDKTPAENLINIFKKSICKCSHASCFIDNSYQVNSCQDDDFPAWKRLTMSRQNINEVT